MSVRPAPSTIAAGKTVLQYEVPGWVRVRSAIPAPTMIGPTVMGSRGPIRWARAPIRDENRSMSTVSGSSDAPACNAE